VRVNIFRIDEATGVALGTYRNSKVVGGLSTYFCPVCHSQRCTEALQTKRNAQRTCTVTVDDVLLSGVAAKLLAGDAEPFKK
jgi:hypothetical protein